MKRNIDLEKQKIQKNKILLQWIMLCEVVHDKSTTYFRFFFLKKYACTSMSS